jgi:pSer/pThr/pTyr-binding forkhead associated (FHA) protein
VEKYMAIVLIIQDGDNSSRIKLTSRPIIVGRSSKCDIKINDDMCSGKHCAFKLNANFKVLAKDLESTNGTYLNDGKIMDTHLMLDDVLKIGSCEIFIDRSELSPKEKQTLTRDEPTAHIKFVSLPTERKKVKPSQVIRARRESQTPNLGSAPQNKEALKKDTPSIKPNEEQPPKKKQVNTQTMSLKERIAAKGKNLGKSSVEVSENPSERQIDLEESSGATKMIKLDKPSLRSKLKKVFKKKKS